MSNYILPIITTISFLTACGGESSTPLQNMGTLKQPIYMPWNYGMEGDTTACSPPWSGGECQVPDQRNITYNWAASCTGEKTNLISNGLWSAAAEVSPLGWTLDVVKSGNWTIHCLGDQTGSPGSTVADTSTMDCHDSQFGEVCQFQGGDIYIRFGVVLSLPAYAIATSNQRRNIFSNILKHEIGHTFGFGPSAPVVGELDPWDQVLEFSTGEIDMLDCYTPGSNTNPSC